MPMSAETKAAYLALPVDVRREILRGPTLFEVMRVLDSTDLAEQAKCEIAGAFPMTPADPRTP